VSATVGSAPPRVPSDVEAAATPTNAVTAAMQANGGGSCGAFRMTNALPGSSLVPALGLVGTQPEVLIPDVSGNANMVVGSAAVDTPSLATGNPVTGKASLTYATGTSIELFPGLSFPDATHDHALAVIQLSSVSISCASNVGTATASYSGTLLLWEQPNPGSPGAYVATSLNWTSGTPNPLLPALNTTVMYAAGVPKPLSTWIQSWQTNNLVQQAPAGASVGNHTVPGVLTIDTQPALPSAVTGLADPSTDLLLSVGAVSCVSEDNR